VHIFGFGKRECFSDGASGALAESIIPSFHMGGFARFFPHGFMGFFWKNGEVGFPEIGIVDRFFTIGRLYLIGWMFSH
jgi:hypothetical protein